MIHIRRAGPLDATPMADLLNAIIERGGTTAMVTPVTAQGLRGWMAADNAVWHLAEDDNGTLRGFQWIAPHPGLPDGGTDIATFVRVGETGMGIGSALFRATRAAAVAMGYAHIHAIIRADNTGGLAYYQSRGFEDFRTLPDQRLDDGTVVTKICERHDL